MNPIILDLKNLIDNFKTNQLISNGYEGRLIQHLRRIDYFSQMLDKYGVQLLRKYLPILQFQYIRNGMNIVNIDDIFVVVDGKIQAIDIDGNCEKKYVNGMLMQAQGEDIKCYRSCTDTSLIKIGKSTQFEKRSYQKVLKMIKDQSIKSQNINNLLSKQKQLRGVLEAMNKIDFFQTLGELDRKQLAINSSIQILGKESITHLKGQSCTNVGYVLAGKIKIVHYDENQQNQQFDKLLKKYLIKRNQLDKDSLLAAQIKAGDWIGLQQHLWKHSFYTSGQVSTQQSQILWIPSQYFQSKFNEISTYEQIKKVTSLIEAKKMILNRSLISKKDKQKQMHKQSMKKQKSKQLLEKIKLLKLSETERNSRIVNTLKKQNLQESVFPNKLAHRFQSYEKKLSNIVPKVPEKVNFFPQEYQKAMIPVQLRRDYNAKEVQQVLSKLQAQKHLKAQSPVQKFCLSYKKKKSNRNPEVIRKMIMDTVTFKTIDSSTNKYSQTLDRSFRSISHSRNDNNHRSKSRINHSIYL